MISIDIVFTKAQAVDSVVRKKLLKVVDNPVSTPDKANSLKKLAGLPHIQDDFRNSGFMFLGIGTMNQMGRRTMQQRTIASSVIQSAIKVIDLLPFKKGEGCFADLFGSAVVDTENMRAPPDIDPTLA